ncbi:MAG: NYN domain-containing protein [Nanoarchaeota archaeon]|nr:NYN domain-containing protein [Nanoarchaeota archaeon]
MQEEIEQKAFIPDSTNDSIQVPGMVRKNNAGLPTPSNSNKKAVFFIDANNWYHNVKRYYNPSEIDITKLVILLAESQGFEVDEIRFYASVPSIGDGKTVYYNHLAYLESLRKKGVKVITRKLQKLSNKEILKKKKESLDNLDLCSDCKPIVDAHFLDLADVKRKEKGIDVWIAVDMLKLSVLENECDVCVLISGDADLVPSLEIIKSKGKEVLTAMTPLGYAGELRRKFPYFIVKPTTLLRCFRDYKGRMIR